MADATIELLKSHFRQLRLPTMGREFERLARDAAATNQNYHEFLLRLTETRAGRPAPPAAMSRRGSRMPSFRSERTSTRTTSASCRSSPSRRCWSWHVASGLTQKINCCLIGSHGTGKTHISIAWAGRVSRGPAGAVFHGGGPGHRTGEGAEAVHARSLPWPTGAGPLLICDELGYVTMSRGGVELLFRVFADRYERGSLLVTSNLPFSEWSQIFQGERMTAALLDRLTHHCHIFEMNGESYRFRESMKTRKNRKSE